MIAPARSPSRSRQRRPRTGIVVTLSNPYTAARPPSPTITGLLLVMAGIAFGVAVARRGVPRPPVHDAAHAASPRRRARLAEGDLSSRVPDRRGGVEHDRAARAVAAVQLDGRPARAERRDHPARPRLQPRLPRRRQPRAPDADRRDAHVHRAAPGPAGRDPAARTEFLESSAVQLDRLDWLAQNLLELSKLDSGLVLLDLRPDDVRGTIESAVEQQRRPRERKGVRMTTTSRARSGSATTRPASARSSSNLVGNAIKFTRARTARSRSRVRRARRRGADRGRGHGRRDRGRGAAADLRPVLSRLRAQRGPRQRHPGWASRS